MVEISITLKDVEKSVALLVILNAFCPDLIKNNEIIISIKEHENSDNVVRMPYEYFINSYDCFGLNEIAR